MKAKSDNGGNTPLLKLLSILLSSDAIEVLGELWQFARRLLSAQAHEGTYEVLDHESQLELCDPKGERALFRKRQRVRFQQDNIIAYQDMAWGDGEIFADYACAPGVEVDRYKEGHRWRVLISLRETKRRWDVEEFRIRRRIENGFLGARESFQIEINHKTRRLDMSVIFPRQRLPTRVTVVEQNLNRSTALGPEQLIRLPDGRLQATWRTDKPRLFEAYILQWEW